MSVIDTVVLDAAADGTSLAFEVLDVAEQVEHFNLNDQQTATLKAVLANLTPDVLHEAVRLAAYKLRTESA